MNAKRQFASQTRKDMVASGAVLASGLLVAWMAAASAIAGPTHAEQTNASAQANSAGANCSLATAAKPATGTRA